METDPPLKLILVLLQVTDNFDRQDFNKMCWTLCSRKNLNQSKLTISNDDAFKIWCTFNFLSEDQYPLVMITEEVGVETILLLFHYKIYRNELAAKPQLLGG